MKPPARAVDQNAAHDRGREREVVEAIAHTLASSTATVQRDWRSARAFLKRAIEMEEHDER